MTATQSTLKHILGTFENEMHGNMINCKKMVKKLSSLRIKLNEKQQTHRNLQLLVLHNNYSRSMDVNVCKQTCVNK